MKTPQLTEPFVTIDDVADYTSLCTKTIRNHVTSGRLPAYRFGRNLRFKLSDVEQHLARRVPTTMRRG